VEEIWLPGPPETTVLSLHHLPDHQAAGLVVVDIDLDILNVFCSDIYLNCGDN